MFILQLVLVQLVAFGFIVLFLKWLFYNQIRHALKRLQMLNKENLEREKMLKEDMERAEREVKRMIEEAKIQAEDIKEEARQTGEKERDDIVVKAKREARRIINDALKDCQRKEAELTIKIQEETVSLAVEMIKYLFTEKNRDNLHKGLVEELIEDIGRIEKEKISIEDGVAKVICARPLDSGHKSKLTEMLSEKFGSEVDVKEEVDAKMIGGFVLKLGRFVVDGSIKNRIKRLMPIIKEKIKTG